MAISDKLTYLNTTKSLIRERLNNLGAELTPEDTFRSYANVLNDLYDSMPKVTGTGTSITLEDTAEAGMRIMLNATDITQETTTQSANLFDEEKYLTETFTTGVYKYALANFKGNRALYAKAQLKSGKTEISGLYVAFSTSTNPNSGVSKYPVSNGNAIASNLTQDFTGYDDLYITYYPTSKTWEEILDVYDIWVSTTDTSYVPFVPNSPSPDYPSEAHTISGDNKVVVCVKNLLNLEDYLVSNGGLTPTYNDDGSFTLSGTATGTTATISENIPVNILANTNYMFSIQQALSFSIAFDLYNDNGHFTRVISAGDTNVNIPNVYSNADKIKIRLLNLTSGTTYNETIYLQLESGTSASSYEPYISQEADIDLGDLEYSKIGNYEDEFIRTSGKNLIGLGTQLNGYVDSETMKMVSSSSTSTSLASVGYYFKTTDLPANITISNVGGNRMNVCYFNEIPANNVSSTLRSVSNDNPRTITINKTYNYIHIQMSYNDTNVTSIMINEGTTALDYEPYGSNEWYIKKNIGKYVFTGNEVWADYPTQGTNYYKAYTSSVMLGRTNSMETDSYCDYFKNNMFYGENNGIGMTKNATYISISNTIVNSSADLKTWVGNNKPIIYYILENPTYTQITGTLAEQLEYVYQLMKSYKGQTNISQTNTDLPFVINASALQDLSTL